jgi:transposase
MRVTSAFSRLLDLSGVWVRSVGFEPDRVVVTVALRGRLLHCPKCSYSTRHRESKQHHDSVWRHLDLGRWRLEVHARLRRVRCPEHGVHVEGVPFARDGARFTRDFENLVVWLATKTDKTATCRLVRIDWQTIGRIAERVGEELLDGDRLSDLFEVSIDEVAWRKGHRYLTLVADHTRGRVVWGCEGKGQAAGDEFFAALRPVAHHRRSAHAADPPPRRRPVQAAPAAHPQLMSPSPPSFDVEQPLTDYTRPETTSARNLHRTHTAARARSARTLRHWRLPARPCTMRENCARTSLGRHHTHVHGTSGPHEE